MALQAVVKCEYLGYKPQRGCIPETLVYRLHLACGHNQNRTESRAGVKRAKCKECGTVKKKPTIAELEAMLSREDGELSIEIQPDGSVRAVEGKPHHAVPKVVTMGEALGSDY